MTMTNAQIKEKAIKAYNEIKSGNVNGVKIYTRESIKVGSITFLLD